MENLNKEKKTSTDRASVLFPAALEIEQGGGRERLSGICVDTGTHC